jgi:hypothetical protein
MVMYYSTTLTFNAGKVSARFKILWWGEEQVSTVGAWVTAFPSPPCSQLSHDQPYHFSSQAKKLM